MKNGPEGKNCKKYRSCARGTIARRIRTEIPDKLSKDARRGRMREEAGAAYASLHFAGRTFFSALLSFSRPPFAIDPRSPPTTR